MPPTTASRRSNSSIGCCCSLQATVLFGITPSVWPYGQPAPSEREPQGRDSHQKPPSLREVARRSRDGGSSGLNSYLYTDKSELSEIMEGNDLSVWPHGQPAPLRGEPRLPRTDSNDRHKRGSLASPFRGGAPQGRRGRLLDGSELLYLMIVIERYELIRHSDRNNITISFESGVLVMKKLFCLFLGCCIVFLSTTCYALTDEPVDFAPTLTNSFGPTAKETISTDDTRAIVTVSLALDYMLSLNKDGTSFNPDLFLPSYIGKNNLDIIVGYQSSSDDGALIIVYRPVAGEAAAQVFLNLNSETAIKAAVERASSDGSYKNDMESIYKTYEALNKAINSGQ